MKVGFSNEEEFAVGLTGWLKHFNLEAGAGLRAVATRMFENIIRRTPVGDPDYWKQPAPPGYVGGYARANWWPSLNSNVDAPRGNGAEGDPGGVIAVGPIIAAGNPGDVFTLQNGVPYILDLENGTGSPRQAPQGMVSVTMADMETFFAQYFEEGASNA